MARPGWLPFPIVTSKQPNIVMIVSDEERRTLEALAYDPDQAEAGCRTVGGYAGYRTAIDGEGRWRYFVAGD